MSQATYKTAIEFLLKWEVGFDRSGKLRTDGGLNTDDGSVTKWGIRQVAHPDLDIPNLSLDDAFRVYKNDYWDVYKPKGLDLDTVPPDYAIVVFDSGFNCGVNRVYGWHSKIALSQTKDPTKALLGLRDKHYFDLVSSDKNRFGKFYKGWINRLNDLKKLVDVIRQDAGTS